MKKHLCTSLLLSALLGSLLIFGAGCSKKTVVPPSSSGINNTTMASGTDINYPAAEGSDYSEENISTEGTLDDAAPVGDIAGGAADLQDNIYIDNQTDEYKEIHGRSSVNLSPIYFDFDQAGIKGEMTEILVVNAQYLNSIPGSIVVIEGNSDERGTNEYNLALAERRAINAKQFLVDLGVEPSRIRTLSYGEEKPLFLAQDENAYSLNRRADFVVK